MTAFVILLILAGIGFVVYLVIRYEKSVDELWKQTAQELGLRYKKILEGRQIEGTVNGLHVIIDTVTRGSGKSRTNYTRYCAVYPKPLGLGLRLTRQGFFSGISKWFGAQDIEVGDSAFDDDVIVKGGDVSRIVEFLTPGRRYRVHRLLTSHPESVIDDSCVTLETTGVETNREVLAGTIHRVARVAQHLSAEEVEDDRVGHALRHRDEGRLDEALQAVRDVPDEDPGQHHEAKVLEGEILVANRQFEDAAKVLAEATEVAPHDQETRELRAFASSFSEQPEQDESRLPPSGVSARPDDQESPSAATGEAATVSKPPGAEDGSPAGPELAREGTAAPEEDAVLSDVDAVCGDLFAPKKSSLEAARRFEEAYQEKAVRWTGTLKRVSRYSFDLVFGREPGVMAAFMVYEAQTGYYSSREVDALVQLPLDAESELSEKIGQQLAFTGRLVRCDGLMRNLYIADGEIEA